MKLRKSFFGKSISYFILLLEGRKMGLTVNTLIFQEKIIKGVGFQWEKIRICELGSQIIVNRKIPAKQFYIKEKNVLEHISLDLNGMYDSLKVDLGRPVPKQLLNRFNLITNYGTTEHVTNQYHVFKNINNMCKVNGVIIHAVPIPNHWINHSRYYYSQLFFSELANLCNYKILNIVIKNAYDPPRPKKNLIYVALIKQDNNNFILNKTFKQLKVFDSKNRSGTGTDYRNDLNNIGIKYQKKKLWTLWDFFVNKIPIKQLRRIFRTIQIIFVEKLSITTSKSKNPNPKV